MLLRELEVEKYWAFPPSYDATKRELELAQMIKSGNYYLQLKTDGNYGAFICDFDGDKRFISRGISTVTKEYGRLEERLFFYDAIAAAFDKPTRIMGEVYYENGIDRDVGSVLRAAPMKSKSIQCAEFYKTAARTIKFSAKDRRDIENNAFFDQKLRWRIFDVWYYDGQDLMGTPWLERQKYVQAAAERINHPLVTYVPYIPMDENFYTNLSQVFAAGGEGYVAYRGDGLPEPGKRKAHKTVKIKRELEQTIDCFIIGTEPPTRNYNGKEIGNWQYWEDIRTGQKLCGTYFSDYQLGGSVIPITKNYYYNWPGAVEVGVYNAKGGIYHLCKVAGLTEELKQALRDNFEDWYLCPLTIGGMMLSEASGLSVRHPYIKSIRKGDIDPQDCTLAKILS